MIFHCRYRKVAADNCTGGLLHPQTKTKCPFLPPGKLSIIPPKKIILKSKKAARFELIQGKVSISFVKVIAI
jgi:hypothetical protein